MRQPSTASKRIRTPTSRFGSNTARKKAKDVKSPSHSADESSRDPNVKREDKTITRKKQIAGMTIGDEEYIKKKLVKTLNSPSQRALNIAAANVKVEQQWRTNEASANVKVEKQPENNDAVQKEKLRHLDGDSFSVVTGYVTVLI